MAELPPTATDIVNVPLWVDASAVALGALAGAVAAVRRQFDLSGILMIAIVTGIGGGLIRDVLLQRGTPVALRSPWLLPTAIVAGLVIFLFSRTIAELHGRMAATIIVLDAVFLAVYSVVGTAKGLEAGLPAVTCVMLGVFTGIGGGLLRDVIMNVEPEVVRPGTLMALAAAIGCTVEVVLVRQFDLEDRVGALGILIIVAVRLLSVWRKWESPLPTDVWHSARRLPGTVRARASGRRPPGAAPR